MKLEFWLEGIKLQTPRNILLFQPPVRSVTPERDAETGHGLEATVSAVRTLVAAMHSGKVPSCPDYITLKSNAIYWTPSFIKGRAPESETSQHYTAVWLSILVDSGIPKDRALDAVVIALSLLEMQERGEVNEADLRVVYAGGVGLRLVNLLDKLKMIADLRAQQEAVSILSNTSI